MRYIVSSCLVGLRTRYDGTDKLCMCVREMVEAGIAVPFCPEQGGGLPTPRLPAEIVEGDGHDVLEGRAKVVNRRSEDVTGRFIKGAEEMLELARIFGASKAILKSLSPSCGVGAIYDGTFSGNIVEGDGVTTALLKEANLEVVTEKEFEDD
ncbi:MAG: DUF523 domain-containing protein [Actinobacteria bacterium]|nr:DUF523 domain-containing protein [Actinomycetota bacterium]